ncbi:MAG: T9SS type A sorting domain-containing protein [Bacteroidota bacterium]
MRTTLKLALLGVLCALAGPLASQSLNYTNHWYFGQNAGVRFNGGSPAAMTGGQINTIEGVSSASDSVTGALLFYTDGMRVWNASHTVMSNGTGLNGAGSSTQSALVVPDPAGNGQYYIFTVPVSSTIGMRWSKVDMSLAGGLGAVTLKNQPLFSPSTERQSAVKHANGTDVWVVGQTPAGTFHSFRVTPTGVVAGAVSPVGPGTGNSIGQLKLSPNGAYLGWVDHGNGSAHLYDFDNATGAVSNHIQMASGFTKAAGCSFSPDNSKFYATLGVNYKEVYQWDLCQTTSAAIAASRTYIGTYSGGWGGMLQLGLDGRIYYSHYSSQFLGVIANPNALGAACNYNQNGFSIAPMTCYTGTPNFVESVFLAAPGGNTVGCTVLDAVVLDLAAESRAGGIVLVSWSAEEEGLAHYEVQRRTEHGFTTLGRRAATGNSGAPATYAFPDADAHAGWNYYRLRMTDLDGRVHHSHVVQAHLEAAPKAWTVYPVPATDHFNLLRPGAQAESTADLRLVNALGQVIWQGHALSGQTQVTVDLQGIAAGVYTLQAEAEGQRFTQSVVVR